jgi:hypothetical protein
MLTPALTSLTSLLCFYNIEREENYSKEARDDWEKDDHFKPDSIFDWLGLGGRTAAIQEKQRARKHGHHQC